MKNYLKIIHATASTKLSQQEEWPKQDTLASGSFMIKIEIPTAVLNQFREEYKNLKGISRFSPWDFDKETRWRADSVFHEIKNKGRWKIIEYRLFFNAPSDQLEKMIQKYGDRIKKISKGGRAEFLYRLDDNDLPRRLLKDGADIGRNNYPLPFF
jgi:hypothetical protein